MLQPTCLLCFSLVGAFLHSHGGPGAAGVQTRVCALVCVHLSLGDPNREAGPRRQFWAVTAWIPARSRIQGPRDPGPTSRPADALVMTELPAANERVGLVLPADFRSHSAS